MTVAVSVDQSNSLPELAARIRAEHKATSAALKSSVAHGIAAGELLTEAKAKVPHGQWLPWLKENCAMSERTAQLYMRLAREKAAFKSATVADLDMAVEGAVARLSMKAADELLRNRPGQFKGFVPPEGRCFVGTLQGDDIIDGLIITPSETADHFYVSRFQLKPNNSWIDGLCRPARGNALDTMVSTFKGPPWKDAYWMAAPYQHPRDRNIFCAGDGRETSFSDEAFGHFLGLVETYVAEARR